jgi:hypothetical protein
MHGVRPAPSGLRRVAPTDWGLAVGERHMDVLNTPSAGVVRPRPRAGSRSTADHVGGRRESSRPFGSRSSFGGHGTPPRAPLPSRRLPASAGGFMASDDELLERTLQGLFAGSPHSPHR